MFLYKLSDVASVTIVRFPSVPDLSQLTTSNHAVQGEAFLQQRRSIKMRLSNNLEALCSLCGFAIIGV